MEELQELIPENAETTLVFFVNGKKVVEPKPDPEWMLLWYLRRKLQLTGTKYSCGEGGCGACTVMLSQYVRREDRVKHKAINACLVPVCAMHGLAVTTVEGIGSTGDRLHPVQERLGKSHGSQCGFCTPGMVMSMYALLRENHKINYSDLETALQGNLCRCTGYRPIIEGFKTFIDGWKRDYACIGNTYPFCTEKYCCKLNTNKKPRLYNESEFKPYDRTQEPIFPPELKLKNYDDSYLFFEGGNIFDVSWIRPRNIEDLLLLKHKYPYSKIVGGNTEIGVEMKVRKKHYPILIHSKHIMDVCEVTNNGICVGAAVTLTELRQVLQTEIDRIPGKETIFEAINEMLKWFAGSQVRNVATLVGNIVTASPISDLNPILMACSCTINVYSYQRGHKRITIDEDFFVSYRKTMVKDDEVVVSVEIPFNKDRQFVKAYKQARRTVDDISIVTAAFNVLFDENKTITHAKICFGGMGPTTICAKNSSNLLKGLQWNENTFNLILGSLNQELILTTSVPGGMAEYRKSLCLSLFFKFYAFVFQKIGTNGFLVSESQLKSTNELPASEPSSSQYFEIRNDVTNISDAVGKPLPHASALKQATGEAIYCDDIPQTKDELYLSLIFSSEPYAKIENIDAAEALAMPGVEAFISASDLSQEGNKMGVIAKDEEIFCKDIVTSRACVIGAIVAKSEAIAQKAKEKVSVSYEKLRPVIISIEEAIEHESYFSTPQTVKKGNIKEAFSNASYLLEGSVRSGAQEHFYLETMSAYATRKEDELEIICTTQNPAAIAQIASQALGIPNHKVISKVKRIGGGFGGKEARGALLGVPVAIAAYKLRKPVRAVLDRDEDMRATGARHPFLTKYRVAFDEDGKIRGVLFEMYSNGGNYMDLSCSVMAKAIFHVDNCYSIPNIEVKGYVCKTNLPSNTAFRGFGGPQAMLAAEAVIREVAQALNKSYEEVAEVNMYREGDLTYYNQTLTYCTITRCWNECIENSDYWRRKKDVEEFNRSSRWKKKGISIVPTKFGVSYQIDFLMQGGALVLIYNDGSVLLSIGGVEMGQGLYIKMIQVASRTLEIDASKIHISEMSTDKVPNSSPTSASLSSDLYGMAVLDACTILKERIDPYKLKNPNGKWEDWVSAAYFDRVSLSATGFYKAPKIEYNAETNSGNLFEYFTYGVACSEVIIDCLTGDHQVLRTDIVMDVGESLNPAIDIGQIEGAFVQGYGYLMMEEMVYSPTGVVLTSGPGTYKIPGFSDIPNVFNVSLLKGAPNPRTVYSSKAIGEPPLFLAASVFFAIKEAIKSARRETGVPEHFKFDVPATCERIRMACEDHFTQQVKLTIKKGGQPWSVIV